MGESPVAWANVPWRSQLVSAVFGHRQPPVLVLSIPRSGSSWVGDVLGNSPQAMYLREPLTQTLLDSRNREGLSFEWVDPADPPAPYQAAAEAIEAGVPAFNSKIVRDIDQWNPLTRRQRRVVVKEVNPFALAWLIRRLGPTLIYLIRHPAAVAASFEKMGWGAALDRRLPGGIAPEPSGSPWIDSIHLQAIALQRALTILADHSDHRMVTYEELCLEPVRVFHDLYDYAELTWTAASESHVERRSSPDEVDSAPYAVSQPSAEMVDAWRNSVAEEDRTAMRDVWLTYDLPYYPAEDW